MDNTTFTPPSLEVLNELLPSYNFTQFIAQGGMGAVYLATQISLDREVAIKILPRELGSDPEFRASFQTEARAMAKLNHPNLIGIYDSGDIDGMLYIAMEYVAGKSLYHSSWNKKIDPAEAKRIIVAICNGLSHAHENGIIHRDIKPANILLTPKIEPKIGDFGLAQAIGVKHEGVVMGTPGYSAPEVLTNPEKADRRSDIFAVGVMLYELMTGKLPEGTSLPSHHCSCPKEFDVIYQRATHLNPVMRYPEVKALAQALESMKSGSAAGPAMKAGAKKAGLPHAATLVKRTVAPAKPVTAHPKPVANPHKPTMVMPAQEAAYEEDEFEDDDDASLAPLPVVTSGSQWPLVRNMLIIAALSVGCVFVYQKIQERKADVARMEREYHEKKREEEMRRAQNLKNPSPNGTKNGDDKTPKVAETEPDPPAPPPKVETPMEQLDRMRFSLSKGDRTQMPKGCKRRGDIDYFLVTTAMTWDEALLFAEEHGGHPALPHSDDEITFLTAMLKNNETIWLGGGKGGREQWQLLDGTAWPFKATPSGTGPYATLSHLGLMRASNGNHEFPFIIAWHRDGSNPCSLDALLAKTRKSLDSKNPSYPPGTVAFGSRHFLPVLRKMDFLKAQSVAAMAGAHISALATKDEGYWVADKFEELKAPDGMWLHAEKNGTLWKWGTSEPWTYAQWVKGFPEDDEDAASIAFVPNKGWINANKETELNGVLLEWSADSKASTSSANDDNLSGAAPDVASLLTKVTAALQTANKERDDKLAANAKSFIWDLDVWFRSLKPFDQLQWKAAMSTIKNAVDSDIIPTADEFADEDGEVPAMHQGIVKIHAYSLEKQKETLAAYDARITKFRDAYVAKIKEMGIAAKNAGQHTLVAELKNLLDAAEDPNDWAESLTEE